MNFTISDETIKMPFTTNRLLSVSALESIFGGYSYITHLDQLMLTSGNMRYRNLLLHSNLLSLMGWLLDILDTEGIIN